MANRRDLIIGLVIGGAFLIFTAITVLFVFGLSNTDGIEFGGFGKRVAIVELKGTIKSSEEIVRQLRRFGDDKSVPAIVLRIDSPGGGVAPSQEIYNEVLRVRRDKDKTVVVSMGSVTASGGLYVASAADWIVANPGTLTGSIGVIFEFPTAEKLFEKIGIRYEVVKSGEFKDMGNFSRTMTKPEAAALQSVIDDTYDQFVKAVAEGRHLDEDTVRTFADGRVFTGRQALGLKLVDQLGDLQDALNKAAEMVDMETPPKTVRVMKRRRANPLDLFGKTLVRWLLQGSTEDGLMTPSLQYRMR